MVEINHLHFEIVGGLSCQALLAAAWAACPGWREQLPDCLAITEPSPGRWSVDSENERCIDLAQAVQLFPQLLAAQTGSWPEQAPIGEWAALGWLLARQGQQPFQFSHGALPLPSHPEGVEELVSMAMAGDWMVRGGGAVEHSMLAIAAFPRTPARPDASQGWQLVGVGYGSKGAAARPDVMLYVGHETSPTDQDQVVVLEANIDDQNPEFYQDSVQRLLAAGALDVLLQPVFMKKQRPGILLMVICRPALADHLAELIFQQTSTLGIRRTLSSRYLLQRSSVTVKVLGQSVRVKLGYQGERLVNVAPEYEDCRRVAEILAMPVKLIYQQAIAAYWQAMPRGYCRGEEA
jgi:uncharacterized protein (DUF111 family)